VILLFLIVMAFVNAVAAEPDDADLRQAVKENAFERDLADGLLQHGSAKMREKYDGADQSQYHFRLDAWLSRGSLSSKLAATRSPKSLLAYLAKSGINHDACLASEYWMLRQFSHVYRDQLRLLNERDFPRAGAFSRSIRDAMNAVNEYLCFMCSERSHHADMIWGQSEWLLSQAKPVFFAKVSGTAGKPSKLWATLHHELLNCRDGEGKLGRENWGKEHEGDVKKLESCLATIRRALDPWNSDGQDYLLTELILLTRDRNFYLYGGVEVVRAVNLIHTRQGPLRRNDQTMADEKTPIGQVMVTLSSGRREILDADRCCAMPKAAYGEVAWITNVIPTDTPATANHRLQVVGRMGRFQIKTKGGWIQNFHGYLDSGATIVSIDRNGEVWIERYDFAKKAILNSYPQSAPKPDPFPDWAMPFMAIWP
jgi:hypothetical protein